MPLPYREASTLKRGINRLCMGLYQAHDESRLELEIDMKERVTEATVKYIEGYAPTLVMLLEKGLITPDWRGNSIRFKDKNPFNWETFSIPAIRVHHLLGNNVHSMELKIEEVVTDEQLRKDLTARTEDNARVRRIVTSAKSLVDEVINKYGTAKYMLTQFPELKVFIGIDKDWKPNPNYKVTPRSAFANSNAFIMLFGECAMFGIKPEDQ